MRSTALLLLPLLVAACAKDPAPTPPEDSTAAAPTAPVDTATTSDPAAPASGAWTVTPTTLGPLRVGMTPEQASAAVDTTLTPDYMEGSTCGYASFSHAGQRIYLMFSEGTLARFDPTTGGATMKTVDGFGVGSTEAQILAKYPSARLEPHHYTDGQYVVVMAPGDTTHRYVFSTDASDVVTEYQAGRMPEVGYIEGCS